MAVVVRGAIGWHRSSAPRRKVSPLVETVLVTRERGGSLLAIICDRGQKRVARSADFQRGKVRSRGGNAAASPGLQCAQGADLVSRPVRASPLRASHDPAILGREALL